MHSHPSRQYSPLCPTCAASTNSRRGFFRSMAALAAASSLPIIGGCGGSEAATVPINNVLAPASILIRNAYLATGDLENSIIPDGSVYIEGGHIVAVGDSASVLAAHPSAEVVLDGKGRLVMPGFVNTHWHATHIFRAFHYVDGVSKSHGNFDLGGNMPSLSEDLSAGFIEIGAGLSVTAQEAYACVAAQLLPMLRAGTTTVVEMSGPFGDVLPRVALDLGMRVVPSYSSLYDMSMREDGTALRVRDAHSLLSSAESYVNQWRNHPSGRVHPWLAYAYAPMASDELLRGIKVLSDRLGLNYGGHVAALKNEVDFTLSAYRARPIERFDRLGLLGERLMGAHLTWVNDAEIARVKATRTSVTLATAKYATSGENTISGAAAVKLVREGVNVCLGTDGSGFNDPPMPTYMHFALMLNEAANDSTVIHPIEAMAMGTSKAARAVGLGSMVGTLRAGLRADITIADISDLRFTEASDVTYNFIANCGMKDIETVIVDGRLVVESGRVKAVDEVEIIAQFQQAMVSVRARNGLPMR